MVSSIRPTYIHSLDGGVDDVVATALLLSAQAKGGDFNTAAILTEADCEAVSALSAMRKTAQFLKPGLLFAMSSSRVQIPFPWEWRMESEAVNQIDCLKPYDGTGQSDDGNHLLSELLKTASKIKIIATGPLTTIADVLKVHPELKDKIEELHWMGGALECDGNILDSPEVPKQLLNGKAEWNVFTDAPSAKWVFEETNFKVFLYPIDISNQTIPGDFIKVLQTRAPTKFSTYTEQCYKIVEQVSAYRMWDVVAAGGVLFPHVFAAPDKEYLRVEAEPASSLRGAILRDIKGREVFVYKQFKDGDVNLFYNAVADTLC